MNFTVIANCQAGPIGLIISALSQKLRYQRIKPIHQLETADLVDFDKIIDTSDIIIHQSISSIFSDFAIEKIKLRFPDKLYISFPSLFFLGYWPGMMYLRKPSGGTMKGVLGDYHFRTVVSAFLEGKSVSQTLKIFSEQSVDNDFFDREFLKLDAREESLDVKSSKFLIENFQQIKLFHVMNHRKRPARPPIPSFIPVIQHLPMQQETAAIHQYDYWAKSVIFLKHLLAKPQGLIHSISRCPASFE